MDYETAVESYIELKKTGRYKEEAIDLLATEISQSKDISKRDKVVLQRHIKDIRQHNRYGDSEPVEGIWNILSKYDGFKSEWAKVVTDILLGNRKSLL